MLFHLEAAKTSASLTPNNATHLACLCAKQLQMHNMGTTVAHEESLYAKTLVWRTDRLNGGSRKPNTPPGGAAVLLPIPSMPSMLSIATTVRRRAL